MAKRKKKETVKKPVKVLEYRVPDKYRDRPIVVVLDGKPTALGRDVIRKGKPPQLDTKVLEATPEQYLELAKNDRYGIELI